MCLVASAQEPRLEVISVEQGLSQGYVPSVCQDEDGFLWFMTNNGLNRYDGYDFKVFRNNPHDSFSLSDNTADQIVDAGDFIFIIKGIRAFDLFNRKTQKVYHSPQKLPQEKALRFLRNGRQSGFLVTDLPSHAASRIYRLEWPEDLAERLDRGEAPESLMDVRLVEEVADFKSISLSANEKQLYLLTSESLLTKDVASGGMNRIALPAEFHNSVGLVAGMSPGAFVFKTGIPKLAHYDGQHWQLISVDLPPDYFLLFSDQKRGTAWFSNNKSVYGFDLNRLPVGAEPLRANYQLPLPEQAISGITDHSGNVFFGTNTWGIRKLGTRSTAFKNYLLGSSIYCTPVTDNRGTMLMVDVRRKPDTGVLLDLRSGQTQEMETLLGISNKFFVYADVDEQGRYWICYSPKTAPTSPLLMRYDAIEKRKEIFELPKDFDATLIRYRAPGQLWLASAKGLLRFDIATQNTEILRFTPVLDSLIQITTMAQTPDGNWWLGTASTNGLLKAVPSAAGECALTIFKANPSDENSLPGNHIKSLLPDPADANVLWIGTGGNGLSRLDLRTNRFTNFSTRNGLPDDYIYGILADNDKPRNLWLSTNRGLARFNPETGSIQYYTKADGLPDDEFNTNAFYKSPTGELLFGGINGLTVFDPKSLMENQLPPEIRLTGLRINGLPVGPRDEDAVLNTDIAFAERLEVPFDQNNIQLQFAAMDFSQPGRNQFAFYLEGAETPWAHRGFEHTAQYLNLAPGTYTFHVKAANSRGIWNETPRSIQIIILPPWYRSWWAYLGYLVLLLGGAYGFYRMQLKRRLALAETERLKEVNQFKSRFFTNISHEFRTPLTVILGVNEQLNHANEQGDLPIDRKTLGNKLGLIRRNGENLLRLINQILDLAKLESNALKINYLQGDVLAFLRYISESLHSLANANNMLLRVESDQAKIMMDYDPERLLQVVHNLISNAIKFTPSGGRVVLKAESTTFEKLSILRITVQDTGVGIPSEELPFIFDRFFQARNQEQAKAGGTGIGLSLTRELVKAMGGSISVESPAPATGKGTVFTVHLPITRNAPEETFYPETSFVQELPISLQQPKMAQDHLENRPLVLLVEDNPDVMEYLGSCLTEQYRLAYAYNGRAGIEQAMEIVPDLIISDVMMPEKDGFEVCETLKNDERTSHIPIILLTAKATVEDRIAGLRRGADAYLAKPFRQEELTVWVEQLISRRRLLQTRYANPGALPVSSGEVSEELVLEDAFIKKIRDVLETHFSDADFSVHVLCRELAMSRPQVHRKLSALTNRSTTEYINAFRLEKAQTLLQAGTHNVSEAAFAVGFNDPRYFSRLFSEEYDVSPSDFRRG